MDKRKVIHAYRRGMISLQECAQILGIDSMQVMGVVNEPMDIDRSRNLPQQPVNT
jgi:hypothetical protein